MRTIQLLVCTLVLSFASGCTGLEGSGTAATSKRSVGNFTEVEVDGALELHLTLQHSSREVELSGDDNLLPRIKTVLHGSRLVIAPAGPLRPKLDLVASVRALDIAVVELGGSSSGTVSDVKSERLKLVLSGTGNITASGEAQELEIDLSGAGTVDASAMRTHTVKTGMSGAGTVRLGEPTELVVEISGAGAVRYRGSPKITEHISGAGNLIKE